MIFGDIRSYSCSTWTHLWWFLCWWSS